jgi:metal-responsive CopG/Arc/MetJ family transcriptional regulator
MPTVKTAITIPPQLLKDVTKRSRKAGVSRSRYIVDAVEAYIRTQDRDKLIGEINRAYVQESDEDRRVRKAFSNQIAKLAQDTW